MFEIVKTDSDTVKRVDAITLRRILRAAEFHFHAVETGDELSEEEKKAKETIIDIQTSFRELI